MRHPADIRPHLPPKQRDAICNRSTSQVFGQPIHVAANIQDIGRMAKRLDEINPVAIVGSHANRVGDHRLGRPEFNLQARRHLDVANRLLPFVGGGMNLWSIGVVVR